MPPGGTKYFYALRGLEFHRKILSFMPPSANSSDPENTPRKAKSLAEIAFHPLSKRQAEVLEWVAKGKRDREIAQILKLSPRTVSKHVHDILDKLCAETRTAAAAWWHERQRLLEKMIAESGS
jgi:DNA-binding NarL/FixJ family response regulator